MTSKPISIATSLKWVGLAQSIRIALQLVGVVVLARILNPADYGLMAMAATVAALAALLRDMGTGAAIVQKEDLRPSLVRAVFWFNVSVGGGLMVLAIASSPLLAGLYQAPRLVPVLCWLAPVFFIEALSITQRALLEREAEFQKLAFAEVASSAVALVVAIFLALGGMGVYALVGQSLVAAVLLAYLLWRLSEWRPNNGIGLRGLREVSSFSANLFAFNLSNYTHRNADSLLIGRYLGSVDLGVYNLAYRLLLFPLQNLTFVVNRTMLPAYSRQQSNPEAIAEHYSRSLRGIALLTAPLMALLWALREPFVAVVFGQRWAPVAHVIAWLAPVGFLQSIISTSGSVLAATGNARLLRNLGFAGLPLMLAAFAAGLKFGVNGVAAAYCLANVLWTFPVLALTFRAIGIKHFVVAPWLPPLVLAVGCAGVVRVILPSAMPGAKSYELLFAGALAGACGYLLLSWMCFPQSLRRLASAVRQKS